MQCTCVRICNNKIYYLRKDYSPSGIYSIDLNDFSSSSLTLVFSDTTNDNKMRNTMSFILILMEIYIIQHRKDQKI